MSAWTTTELRFLREHADHGAAAIAEALGRSVPSVKAAGRRDGILLKIGRPALSEDQTLQLPARIRRDLASGLVTESDLSRRMRLRDASLCPDCALRPAEVPSSGLCRCCHLKRLAAAHRDAIAEIEAQRELWEARQRHKRARDRLTADMASAGCSSVT